MSDLPTTAVEAEATGTDTIQIDWMGITVTLPARADGWDLDALAAFEQGKAATAVQGMMGSGYSDVVAAFQKKHGRKPRVADLEPLMEQVAKAYGFESPGE